MIVRDRRPPGLSFGLRIGDGAGRDGRRAATSAQEATIARSALAPRSRAQAPRGEVAGHMAHRIASPCRATFWLAARPGRSGLGWVARCTRTAKSCTDRATTQPHQQLTQRQSPSPPMTLWACTRSLVVRSKGSCAAPAATGNSTLEEEAIQLGFPAAGRCLPFPAGSASPDEEGRQLIGGLGHRGDRASCIVSSSADWVGRGAVDFIMPTPGQNRPALKLKAPGPRSGLSTTLVPDVGGHQVRKEPGRENVRSTSPACAPASSCPGRAMPSRRT